LSEKQEQIEKVLQIVQAALKACEEEYVKMGIPLVPQQATAIDNAEFKEIVRQALYGYQRDGQFRKPGEGAAGSAGSADFKEEARQALYGYKRNPAGEKV
jgi:hypothetical protein